MLHSFQRAIDSLKGPLDAWMNDSRNVRRFLLVRFLLMAGMVLAFGSLYLTRK